VEGLWRGVSYLCPRAALRSVREGALAACLAAASSAVQCTQQDVQDPHVGTLAVRDGARIDRAGCLRDFELR
jgi:hypothetical protein